MKFEKTNSAEEEFSSLFEFDSNEDLIENKAYMIMFRCLSEIQKNLGGNPSKKQLSELVETSPSYITQLFRGDKLINLLMLAKFELALDSEFDITLRKKSSEKKTFNIIDLDNFSIKNLHGDRMPTNITTSFGDGHARISGFNREAPTKEFAQSSAKSFSKTLA